MSNLEQEIRDLGIIDLGWAKFSIEFIEPFPIGDPSAVYGDCDFERWRIQVVKGLDDRNLKETLLHECVHAIHALTGMNEDELSYDEEQRCNLMTKGLIILFNLNPKLKDIIL